VYRDYDENRLIKPGPAKYAIIDTLEDKRLDQFAQNPFRRMNFYENDGLGSIEKVTSIGVLNNIPHIWEGRDEKIAVIPVLFNTDNVCTAFDPEHELLNPNQDGRVIIAFDDKNTWEQESNILQPKLTEFKAGDYSLSEDPFQTRITSDLPVTKGGYYDNQHQLVFSKIAADPFKDINEPVIDVPATYTQTTNGIFPPEEHSAQMRLEIDGEDIKGWAKVPQGKFRRYSYFAPDLFYAPLRQNFAEYPYRSSDIPYTVASVIREDGITTFSADDVNDFSGQLVFGFLRREHYTHSVLNFNDESGIFALPEGLDTERPDYSVGINTYSLSSGTALAVNEGVIAGVSSPFRDRDRPIGICAASVFSAFELDSTEKLSYINDTVRIRERSPLRLGDDLGYGFSRLSIKGTTDKAGFVTATVPKDTCLFSDAYRLTPESRALPSFDTNTAGIEHIINNAAAVKNSVVLEYKKPSRWGPAWDAIILPRGEKFELSLSGSKPFEGGRVVFSNPHDLSAEEIPSFKVIKEDILGVKNLEITPCATLVGPKSDVFLK
jgi:hypothetical protein